ncbi:SulP family inorganic anion transporter [Flavobacterium agricola]|uniref:SulP family inorganic anion transporter n=1 Tax=Flavobacterium agricola TaxID=2870839 RepID=A0ABY6M2Y1_9FLAO|nr:SulP family inorganic anion transporter [Flavobacterium agricola]UYW02145.1 SulP family inorganic anion transporter [Flavobacterium agricola]
MSKNKIFGHLKSDFASGLVVFLVALPLCLGIAMASGAPLFSGIISGVVGGIVVGFLSNSNVSVTGPAAGLTAIVLTAIAQFNNAFQVFLLAVLLAGIIQMVLGFLKAGSISNYFPNNVIEGMLAGIGLMILLQQLPLAFGYTEKIGLTNLLSGIADLLASIHYGALCITLVSLAILIAWDKFSFLKKLKLVPGALVAVVVGILINQLFISLNSSLAITNNQQLVSLPIISSFNDFGNLFIIPDFSAITNPAVWVVAFTIAIVASIESLLCIEASDRLDPQKRVTNTNVELKAQGIGNMVSSLLGGLPMTSVVVRSSANINAGAKTKMSAVIHGFLLLICALSIPFLLNKIPLATLAAVLIMVGYKLAKPAIIVHFWQKGKYQFAPFIATLAAVVFLDLLKAVALGMVIAIFFILRGNSKRAYYFKKEDYHKGDVIYIDLAQEVSFLNKAAIKNTLNNIPKKAKVVINASDTVYIAHDVLDLIAEFKNIKAVEKKIDVKLVGFKAEYQLENSDHSSYLIHIEHEQVINYRKKAKSSHQEVIKQLSSIPNN